MRGGATFDVAVRFIKEDPWERVRVFKQHVKNTPLKMVSRSQNLVGYHAYPDDIVESLERSHEILGELKESRGGKILDSKINFFICGVTKLLPAVETLGDLFEPESSELFLCGTAHLFRL